MKRIRLNWRIYSGIGLVSLLVLVVLLDFGTSAGVNAVAVGRLVDPLTGTWGIEPGKYIIADCNREKELEFEIFNTGYPAEFSIEGASPSSISLSPRESRVVKVTVVDCLPIEITVLKLNQGNIQSRLKARVEIEQ